MTLLLVGDIGGTKTLLSLYRASADGLQCLDTARFPSADWSDLAPMVREFLDAPRPGGPAVPGAACLAEACGIPRVELVNDFAVLIYGLPHLREDQLASVRAGQALDGAPLLVLGAGTGLGVALGVPTASGLLALPTEGGHGTFAPRTEEEWRLSHWLRADLGVERLSVERVVSGTGLGAVARWLLAERDPEGRHPLLARAREAGGGDWPSAVAAAAEAGDPLALEARALWLGAYGAATGDLALTSLCRGGIWLAGGTAAKQLEGLRSPAFLDPFLAKGRLRPVLDPIPIQAITDPEVGVFSAACRARMLLG